MKMQQSSNNSPSDWVVRFVPLLTAGGQILDLACGYGRHSRYLASQGFQVEALDQDADALATLAEVPGVVTRCADIEGGPWPYYGRQFDGIVVTRYLWRPILPMLFNCLAEGGVLIYETFMEGNERHGKPSNPQFLLRRNELLELTHKRFGVVAFEQGEIMTPAPAVIQRICVCRRQEFVLPLE